MGCIYIIRCLVNNKVYIGQTILGAQKRWNAHKSAARYNKQYLDGDKAAPRSKRGMCSKLYRAINKHGVNMFEMNILDECGDDRDTLDTLETAYIKEYDSVTSGYNLKYGGDSSNHSQETRDRLKIINAENMKRTYVQFRKHKELDDLPMYCIYLTRPNTVSVAINRHPLCVRKEFSVHTYGSIDAAKIALREYLDKLEASGIPALPNNNPDLPRGVTRKGSRYIVNKCIAGQKHLKSFSSGTDDENKRDAIAYVEQLI